MREKLIELMTEFYGVDPMYYGVEAQPLADYLIANGVTIQKWIPVKEQLPDTSGMYIVAVEKLYGIIYSDVAYFDVPSKKWGTNTHHYSCDKVTHWMTLPEPHRDASE